MATVKSFRIEDILVGNNSKSCDEGKRDKVIQFPRDKMQKSNEKESTNETKVNLRRAASEDRKSTTSDSGNSSRASTPAMERDVSQEFPITVSSSIGNSNTEKKPSPGAEQTHVASLPVESNNNNNFRVANSNAPGIGGQVGFYPHPHYPLMYPLSREEKCYPASPHMLPYNTTAGLMDSYLPKTRAIFGGRPHPSLMCLTPAPGMDYSLYSHHPMFPGPFYGVPMHEGSHQHQQYNKAHQQHQQLMDRVNYPSSMFQLNRPATAAMFSVACKRKGGQIRFTNSQTAQLEKAFVQQKYLNANDRKRLAHSLGLSDRQVKTWFQNRRAKLRKCKAGICSESEMTGSPQDNGRLSPENDDTDTNFENSRKLVVS